MRTAFIQALVTAGVPYVGVVRTRYCRDDYGNPIPGCKGHHTARVMSCNIDIARNVCVTFNSKGNCQSASVYM